MRRSLFLAAAVTAAAVLARDARAQVAIALTSTGSIATFDAATPGTILSNNPVSGLLNSESLVAIDVRPIDNALVGFGYNSTSGSAHVYTIAPDGTLTSINALTLATGLARVTADFNPAANALRVVTSGATGNNLRIPNGGTGALATDTNLNPANSGIRATAYSRNNAGGGTQNVTTLYEIDGTNNALVTQGSLDFSATAGGTSPNTGTLMNSNPLTGVTGSNVVGFEIFNAGGTAATSQGTAYLATSNTFFTLNLTSGNASPVGTIGGGLTVLDIAAVPEPGSMALCGVAVTGAAVYWRTRRKA